MTTPTLAERLRALCEKFLPPQYRAAVREAADEIERLTRALSAAERERDRYEDCLRVVCHHLELPQSESGACDDSSAYDRALDAADLHYRETEAERVQHSKARYAAEAERDALRERAGRMRKALEEIAELQYSEAGEPLDDAIDLAKEALAAEPTLSSAKAQRD